MGGACGTYGRIGAYRILMRIPEGRRPFSRPTSRWEYNIKFVLHEIRWGA